MKKGFDFTLMVAGMSEIITIACDTDFMLIFVNNKNIVVRVLGESGLGKSTLVNSLFLTDLYKDRKLLNAEGKNCLKGTVHQKKICFVYIKHTIYSTVQKFQVSLK